MISSSNAAAKNITEYCYVICDVHWIQVSHTDRKSAPYIGDSKTQWKPRAPFRERHDNRDRLMLHTTPHSAPHQHSLQVMPNSFDKDVCCSPLQTVCPFLPCHVVMLLFRSADSELKLWRCWKWQCPPLEPLLNTGSTDPRKRRWRTSMSWSLNWDGKWKCSSMWRSSFSTAYWRRFSAWTSNKMYQNM